MTTDAPHEITVTPGNPDRTLEWITVLSAAGLDYRLSRDAAGWQLHVPATHADRAREELDAYERERMPAVPQPQPHIPRPEDAQATWIAFWFAHLIVLCFVWWGAFDSGHPAHMAGGAQAGRILAGEWWRTLTALTLHSGLPHLAGNVLFIALIGPTVLRCFGLGTGLWLMLAGGMAGNALAAMTASPMQLGVGASTMAFAALGSMSAWRTVDAWRHQHVTRAAWPRIWIPLAAGIALLGFLGSAPHSDLAAHVFGFLAGALLALPLSLAPPHIRLPPRLQRLLIPTAFAAPVIAWLIALRTLP